VFFAFDLLHHDGQDMRRTPLIGGRSALRKLIEPDPRFLIQFSDHFCGVGAKFFKAAAELGLEGIISKRAVSLYQSGPSRLLGQDQEYDRRASSWCSAPT
jgi:bifunctional non-homologous end joining protein LigD